MTSSRATRPRIRRLLATLFTVLFVAGCGGSTDGGGGQLAGIEGTGIVSGFGSVYVDGIEFSTDQADILFNGTPADEARLRVGDVVTVVGSLDADGRAQARRIVFDRVVDGPIARIDVAPDGSGQLLALGQTVRFDADTHFINTEAQALAVGDLIAVSGVGDESGNLRATSIERGGNYTPETLIDVEGRVAEATVDTFRIGSQTIQYSPSTIEDTNITLADGDYVQVFGRQASADAPLIAERILLPSRRIGEDEQRVFIEGMLTATDGNVITVAGQRIDIQDADRVGNADTTLSRGRTVSIRGTRRGAVIVADTLRAEPEPTVTLRARLNTIDDEQDKVTLLGTRWQVVDDTLYLDQSDMNDRRLRLPRLSSGDTIEAIGYSGPDGLIMTRLNRVIASPVGDASLSGPVDTLTRDGAIATIELAGAAIVTREGTTEFRSSDGQTISADAFYAAVASGAVISATGPDNGNRIDTAREVQLLD